MWKSLGSRRTFSVTGMWTWLGSRIVEVDWLEKTCDVPGVWVSDSKCLIAKRVQIWRKFLFVSQEPASSTSLSPRFYVFFIIWKSETQRVRSKGFVRRYYWPLIVQPASRGTSARSRPAVHLCPLALRLLHHLEIRDSTCGLKRLCEKRLLALDCSASIQRDPF